MDKFKCLINIHNKIFMCSGSLIYIYICVCVCVCVRIRFELLAQKMDEFMSKKPKTMNL